MRVELGSVELGGKESDRAGEHRKLIMGLGHIGQCESKPRTDCLARPKAATVPEPGQKLFECNHCGLEFASRN
jgi:hypothetical protein